MVVARVRRTIRERGLIEPGARVVVACSGGPDSAALLLALVRLAPELRLQLEAASVDHGLRKDARQDVALAAAQAAHAGVPFHALSVDVERKGSVQAAARRARYAALRALARRVGATRIAVGHTRDDQAETVLLRLLRGASLRGLAAIAPRRADSIVRPLIDCDRAAVAAFAARQGVAVARDPSNSDARFTRARLRARVLPLLVAENPHLVAHLCAVADDARAVLDALGPSARELLEKSIQTAEMIDISAWSSAPEAVRRLALRRWLEPLCGVRLGRAHVLQLDAAIRSLEGEVWLPSGVTVQSGRDSTLRARRTRGSKPRRAVRSRRKRA